MIYRVLLVDDEMPSLRYIQNIIEKYAPAFKVASAVTSGEKALEYLNRNPVDLLITDISMDGMDGIDLSKRARALQPDIHIIIISGYAQFDYAQGAIQASVEEYILKPVTVSQMRLVLDRLKETLMNEFNLRLSKLLPAIACGGAVNFEEVRLLYGARLFRFAIVRFGNLNLHLSETLSTTSLIFPINTSFFSLRGRDDEEQILIFPDQALESFLTDISVYISEHSAQSTWTVIYQSAPRPIDHMTDFIRQAIPQLHRQVSIGCHQMIPLSTGTHKKDRPRFSAAELRQMTYFITSGKPHNVKEYFLSLASDWETRKIKQVQAWVMVRQMIHHLAENMPTLEARLDDALDEMMDLFLYAASYGDLLAGICSTLFDDYSSKDRKMSARELYDYAIEYIDDNYAKPLSMQSVCEEIGISQTYLSRLFRKYSDVTFNVYLTRRRMTAAMKLLQEHPGILLRDVASCVGYEDSSYFSKVFHQFSGLTPSQYAMRRK